ncbi:hypothetical protein B0H14DRAFT_2579227 [Mycena olivaceomarginata]|nr:hypothetical protein B0H14DRAFT_2579227 [Mycena olivaceomarginata]
MDVIFALRAGIASGAAREVEEDGQFYEQPRQGTVQAGFGTMAAGQGRDTIRRQHGSGTRDDQWDCDTRVHGQFTKFTQLAKFLGSRCTFQFRDLLGRAVSPDICRDVVDTLLANATDFNIGPLLSRAVAEERDDQEDSEPHDALDDIDDEWPPRDPWNEVDDLPPPPSPPKRRASPSFEDVVAAGPPQKGNHRRRALKRARRIEEEGFTPRAATLHGHVQPAPPLHLPCFNAAALPTAHGAYAAKVEDKDEKRGAKQRRSLAELIAVGFQLIRWDGIAARPLVDSAGRIFAVLAGQPNNASWRAAVGRAYESIKKEGSDAHFPAAMCRHRRGLFAAVTVGLGYGKGQRTPAWINNKQRTPMVDRLLANPDITRLANFASFPGLTSSNFSCVQFMGASTPQLLRPERCATQNPPPRPFPKSVFSTATFNFGPRVWTFKPRDVCNLPFGWCAVQSLGDFDAAKGGHLVLWDLQVVVEFPAGALILLPSATVSHSIVPVEGGEERISFTQFTAGGMFRWVENGGRTGAELAREDPDQWERVQALKETRWETGLSYFSMVDELLGTESNC